MEPGDLDLRDLTQSLIVGDGERSLGTERRGFLVGFAFGVGENIDSEIF